MKVLFIILGLLVLGMILIGAVAEAIFLIGISLVVLLLVKHFASKRKRHVQITSFAREFQDKKVKENAASFYTYCLKRNINDVSELESEEIFEKARLIAEMFAIPEDKIKESYVLGCNTVDEAKGQNDEEGLLREQERILAMKRKEDEQRSILTKYFELAYRDKPLKILYDKLEPLRIRLSEEYAIMENSCSTSGFQKEQNWAFRGGIATAIDGPVAAIKTALDVRNKNRQIKVQNEALVELKTKDYDTARKNADDLLQAIERIQDRIEKVETKSVLAGNTEELFKCLDCSVEKCYISKTGNFKITVNISQTAEMSINDIKDTFIDGSLKAVMYQNNEPVGYAKLVLPGRYCSNTKIKGISENAVNNSEFRIEFEPYKLWVIEK